MTKIKNCSVRLISEDNAELFIWLKQIETAFDDVRASLVDTCRFDSEGITDYRMTVYFASSLSKDGTYRVMNRIKANPITFY